MRVADPVPRVLLAYAPDGRPIIRAARLLCEWPSTPGLGALDMAIETVLTVLEDAHGFTMIDRVLVGQMASRDLLAYAGFPEFACGPLYGRRARQVDEAISRLRPKDLVQVTWAVSHWLNVCARSQPLPTYFAG